MANTMRGILFLLLLCSWGCGKSKSGDDTKWPEQPASGAPVALEFVSMDGAGDDLEAVMNIFNFSDKTVKSLHMELHYQDAAGADLKTFPWSQSAGMGLVDGKKHVQKKMGAFIPAGTVKVTAELRKVEFKDGSTWQKP